MILQALANHYNSKADEMPSEGFEQKEIPFLIIINKRGEFRGLQDTRSQSGKKLIARKFTVPKENARCGKNAWQKTNLLWDHYGYVLGHAKSDDQKDRDMAQRQHNTFLAQINELSEKYSDDEEIMAISQFYANEQHKKVFEHKDWEECAKIKGCNLSFQLEGSNQIVCQCANISSLVSSSLDVTDEEEGKGDEGREGLCLITGNTGVISRLHPRTPIAGAKSNAKIVSFQIGMGFDSYGKLQSYNAPVSKGAAFAYTTALNTLLAKESRQKLYVGDSTTVFWAERKHEIEGWFTDIFGEPAKGESDQDNAAIRALFESMKTGIPPSDWELNHFYVLGLAPNSARIAVRFWYAGTVAEVAKNIMQHFKDISIVHAPHLPEHLSLFRLLTSTALLGKTDNIQPNLAGDFMKAILAGTPYPSTLLASTIRRIMAEQSRKDRNGKSIPNVSYERASLIKAVLDRNVRYYNHNEKEVGMALDTNNTNPGYLLGRLFAVLEKVQIESAGGEGKINATIRDRFYGSASSIPVFAFPYLMKLKNHHLAKLENFKGFYEKLIGEITDKVIADKSFPSHLSLDDQGRFAIGYYHQRQDFFKKKDSN